MTLERIKLKEIDRLKEEIRVYEAKISGLEKRILSLHYGLS